MIVLSFYCSAFFGFLIIEEYKAYTQQDVPIGSLGVALTNGVLLAILMLLFERLDIGRWRKRRPLIYPTLIEATVLTIFFMVFNIIQKRGTGLSLDMTLSSTANEIGDSGLVVLPSIAAIMFVSSIPFFAFWNAAGALGANQLKSLLLGTSAER
jgi:hypothetical protein